MHFDMTPKDTWAVHKNLTLLIVGSQHDRYHAAAYLSLKSRLVFVELAWIPLDYKDNWKFSQKSLTPVYPHVRSETL